MERASHPAAQWVAERYEIQGELARGGMGVVYRAVDHATGRTLAFKRSSSKNESGVERANSMLQREYQTLVTLRHPYIIQVFDFGVDEVGPYYTMELLDGVDLRARCPLPWREVCAYMRDVASSLALLHSRRLIHSDVTPANIRLTGEGRAKLLDFGALASFGRASVIAGTPTMVPPEMLAAEELDQRVDLYALGASAYYALCGRHAYPATSFALLPAIWARGRPPAPSTFISDIPRELDQLVLALLEQDRMSRPASAAEVIDRMAAIAGLAPDRDLNVQRSYLHTTVVGRDAERKKLEERLKRAFAGRGGGALIAGASGTGKSFLLEEVLQSARLAGARVFTANARADAHVLGPDAALLREAAGAENAGQGGSVEQIFQKLAEVRPIVIAIEDLHKADADSLSACAALAKSVRQSRVMLLGTYDPNDAQAQRPAMQLLRQRLPSLELAPFDEKATYALAANLFGDVAAVPRLVTFLQNHALGNPRACVEVIRYLIDQNLIRYAEGTWVLPDELPATGPGGLDLGAIVEAAFESRVAHWSAALRALAMCLSPQRRVFDFALCKALAEGEPELAGKDLTPLLAELVREGVLVEGHGAYAFAGAGVREALYRKLGEEQKKRLHLHLAQRLFETVGANPSRAFEIGFHFLIAGEDDKARKHIRRNVEASLMDPDLLVEAVPDLWALLHQQRSAGATDEDVQFIEGMLTTSGYYTDPRGQDQFDERSLRLIQRTVGFELASRLSPWLGRPLALTVGLLTAGFKSLFRKPHLVSGSFRVSLLFFVGVAASMSAAACIRLERPVHGQLAKLFSVAGGLPRLNAFRLLYDLFSVGANLVRGHFVALQAGLEDQLERLPRIPMITKESQHQWDAGLQLFIGRNQLLRLDSTTLQCVERMEARGGTHDRVTALFLRRTYHLYRGDLVSARREEERFDQMAASVGSRWVADVIGVLEFLPYHWSHDVLGLKRTLHRIEQLVDMAPGLATHREVIRAIYEGHRGRPDNALTIYASLDDALTPFTTPVWSVARGHQAECLNALGRHAEALEVCEQARGHLSREDRAYVFAYQQLERESAIALAGLDRFEEAQRLLDGLLAECAGYDNPLVIGSLHHDRARIACMAGDEAAFETHAQQASSIFGATHNPALIARTRRLFELGRRTGVIFDESGADTTEVESNIVDKVRAGRALSEVVDVVGANAASLYLFLYGKAFLAAQHGEMTSLSLAALDGQLAGIARDFDGFFEEGELESAVSRIEARSGAKLVPLSTSEGAQRQVVGMIVLSECEKPGAISQLSLVELASQLIGHDEDTDLL